MQGLLERTKRAEKIAEYEAALFVPPLPRPANYIWRMFTRLRSRKGSNGFGAGPLEWPDIAAFCALARISFTPWELEIVELLDDLFVAAHSKAREE